MSVRVDPKLLRSDAKLVPPPCQRACEDHHFEMPTGVYVAMAALLFGFLAVLAIGLANPNLVVPMAINFIFLTAFFAVPVLFVVSAKDGKHSLSWGEFMKRGLDTATGRASGPEAVILTLMLPLFIFGWSVAIVAINAII